MALAEPREIVLVAVPEQGIVPAVGPGLATVQVAELGLAIVQVVGPEQGLDLAEGLELEIDQEGALELAIVRVAAEPGLDRVAGPELEIGHPLAHLAVLLRTRSVIAAHRRGLVPVLGAEDLVGAVETTREPAAAEVAKVWAAAE